MVDKTVLNVVTCMVEVQSFGLCLETSCPHFKYFMTFLSLSRQMLGSNFNKHATTTSFPNLHNHYI